MKLTPRTNAALSWIALSVLTLSISPATASAEPRPAAVPSATTAPPAHGSGTADFDAVVQAAEAARLSGDQPHAITLYQQAVQLRPAWPDGWWFLGSLEYATNDYVNARDALTHFISLNPPAGPATALRGLCEFETGDYVQALKDIQSGVAHGAVNQPRTERILRAHEALLLTRNGRFEDSLQSYAFFAHDGAPEPQMAAGIGLAGLRRPLLPTELAPDQRELFSDAGSAIFQFMAGDTSGAKQAFQALFVRHPAVPNLHYIYGYYLLMSDPDAAASEFDRELKVNPTSAPTEAMLAWTAITHNDSAAARPHAQRAVDDDPSLPLAQLVFGRSLVDAGDLTGGIAHLEKALQLDPANVESHIALARAYSEAGRKADAYRQRHDSLALTMDEPIAHP